MGMHFNRPRFIAWVSFFVTFSACLWAGFWQVDRLHWKQGIIATLAEAKTKPARDGLPKDVGELNALQFYPVTIRGSWLGEQEFHITPRYLHDQFGYWVIHPFRLNDGRVVLVNRGWIPGAKKLPETRPETKVRGKATLTGLVRVGAERNYFTPKNQPEKNLWFGRDIEQMAEFAKLTDVVPAMVDVVAAAASPKTLPTPSDGIIRLRNDHLGYIYTWFGIAAGILLVFVLYHRKKRAS